MLPSEQLCDIDAAAWSSQVHTQFDTIHEPNTCTVTLLISELSLIMYTKMPAFDMNKSC